MIRPVLISATVASLAVAACGDSDDRTQASAEEAATTTIDTSSLEAWCLGWASPPPETPDTNDGLRIVFEAMQAQREAMLEVAPAEIVETNRAVVDYWRELNAYLADNDWDPNSPRMEGDEEFGADQEALYQFGEDNC